MRILSIGNFYHPSWDGSLPDEEHIAKALEELGHEVIRWQRDDPNLNYGGTMPWFDDGEPDFTLIAQWDGYDNIKTKDFDSSFIKELPRPLVYWAFDYQADGQEWHERLIKQADLYLSKRIADSKYPNWQWFSQDFAPQFLLEHSEKIQKDIDVLFTGSYIPWATERNDTLRKVNEKYNLVIHSVNEWPKEWNLNVRPPIMDEGLSELYAQAKINLAIDHTIEAGYWSDRISQIMACGGFVLARYVPMMETRFHSHIAYYFGIDDILDAIDHWIDRDEDRGIIAAEAYDNSAYYKVKEKTADLLNIVRNIL